MVFPLVGDVLVDGFDIGFGNGERPVARLPGKRRECRPLRFDPFGRRLFNVLDDLTDRNGAGEIEEKVGVVFHRIDKDRGASQVLQHGGHVGVQRIANRIGDEGFATLGAEDEMDMKAGEGLRHRLGRPFRALVCWWIAHPGRCPGLSWRAPLGRGFKAPKAGGEVFEFLDQDDVVSPA